MPDGMVYVPGGRYQIASRDLQMLTADLEDYIIDRLEVTNVSFAGFVDAGYWLTEYWSDMTDGPGGATADLRRAFVAGPACPHRARGQAAAPRGLEQHPVADVSWYEAAAF